MVNSCDVQEKNTNEALGLSNKERAEQIKNKYKIDETEGMSFELNEDINEKEISEEKWEQLDRTLADQSSSYERFKLYNDELKIFNAEIVIDLSREDLEIVNEIKRSMAYAQGKTLTDLYNVVKQYPQFFSEQAISNLHKKIH